MCLCIRVQMSIRVRVCVCVYDKECRLCVVGSFFGLAIVVVSQPKSPPAIQYVLVRLKFASAFV